MLCVGKYQVLVGQGADGIIDEFRYSNADKSTTLTQDATTYSYNERNQLVTATTGESVKAYTYDNNGNNIGTTETVNGVEISAETMTYDELNRMLSYTGPRGTESFTYRGVESEVKMGDVGFKFSSGWSVTVNGGFTYDDAGIASYICSCKKTK